MAIAVACVPAAEAAGGKATTRLTIDAVFLATGSTHWSGDIFSGRKACKDKRLVLVFRVRPGADQKVGQTRSFKGISSNKYFWTMDKPGAYPSGNYYAKVNPTRRCKGDRSGNLASDF
jgi:hypothetical protein